MFMNSIQNSSALFQKGKSDNLIDYIVRCKFIMFRTYEEIIGIYSLARTLIHKLCTSPFLKQPNQSKHTTCKTRFREGQNAGKVAVAIVNL